MRLLKTFTLALGGLIAAVFGSAFFVAAAPVATGATAAPGPDLQAKRVAPATDVVAGRDAKPAGKTPQPQPYFPSHDFARSETPRVACDRVARILPGVRAPLI